MSKGGCKGPCKDPCKPGACVHVCTHRKISRFSFSTGIVFPDLEKTRSVEKIEFQCHGAMQGPVHSNCVRARVHRPLHDPLTLEFNFPTDLVFSMSGKTMPVENKNLEIFLWVHTCTHAPGLHGSLHGPVHTPTTLEFNFFDLSRLFCVRTDYAN